MVTGRCPRRWRGHRRGKGRCWGGGPGLLAPRAGLAQGCVVLALRGVKVRALDAGRLPPAVELLPVELLGKIVEVRKEPLIAGVDGCAAWNAKASREDLHLDAVEGPAPEDAPPARIKGVELAPVGGVDGAGGSQLDGGQLVC